LQELIHHLDRVNSMRYAQSTTTHLIRSIEGATPSYTLPEATRTSPDEPVSLEGVVILYVFGELCERISSC
jgi:hypothetical protein